MATLEVLLMLSVLSVASSNSGEFTIVHAPDYVVFLPERNGIDTSEIPVVIASYLGLPFKADMKWKGLAAGSPFKRPKATVIVSINSLPNNELNIGHKMTYKTHDESDGEFDSEMMITYIQSLDWKKEPMFVDFSVDSFVLNVKSSHQDLFADLPSTLSGVREDATTRGNWFKPDELPPLNVTEDADLVFVSELYMMREIVKILTQHEAVLKKTKSPDFYHFKVTGLEELEKTYGVHSAQMQTALRLLKNVVEQMSVDFQDLYDDNCVVQVVGLTLTTAEARSRKGRNLLDDEVTSGANSTLNLAPQFSSNYAVFFNIILWTMVALALAVFAISWGIWNMDPGRDSLIYRMTTQRKKND